MVEIPRSSPRRRMLKGVKLVTNDGHSTFDATLRDLSETGARIRVENTLPLPEHVDVLFDDGSRRQSRIIHRTLTEIGVVFIGQPR